MAMLSESATAFLVDVATWDSLAAAGKKAVLLELLRFVHATADQPSCLELRKKIGFWFVQAASSSKTAEILSHLSTEEVLSETLALVHSLDVSEQCSPTGTLVRTMVSVDGVADVVLNCDVLESLRRCLCRTRRGTACIEAWSIMFELVRFHKPAIRFVLTNFDFFVKLICECMQSTNFIAKRHALRLLNAILGDPSYARARLKLAESPALLCAVMRSLHDASHHIQFEAYHCLKVFLAKPNKPAAIRYLISCNREGLADFLNEYSTGDPRTDSAMEDEKALLLQRLINVEPVTHEEQVLLGL